MVMVMNSRRKMSILKIVVVMFIFNLTSFFLYLSSHPDFHLFHRLPTPLAHKNNSSDQQAQFQYNQKGLKPWPILPSYLPWSQTPTNNVTFRSCEAYFGNGFTRQIDLLTSAAGGGWFRCYYSETLRSSICEGGRVRMWPGKVGMSKGGERLEEVIGRGEEVELPEFEEGAFEVDGGGNERRMVREDRLDEFVPRGQIGKHTMRELIRSVRVAGDREFDCDQVGFGFRFSELDSIQFDELLLKV